MYDNGYIVKCRSILTNDICLSEASHKADVFLVCISYLTYSLKKCIDNLAVWKIRVNTHILTGISRALIYLFSKIIARQYIIKHLIYNGLPESIIRGYPCLTTKVPINTHPLPYCLKKGRIFLWSDGTGERSLRPNIVGFLFPPITV